MFITPVLRHIQWSVVVVGTVVYSPGQLCLVVSRIIPGSPASNLLLQHSPKFCGLPTILWINCFSAKLNQVGFCLQLRRVYTLKLDSFGSTPRCQTYQLVSLSIVLYMTRVPQLYKWGNTSSTVIVRLKWVNTYKVNSYSSAWHIVSPQ